MKVRFNIKKELPLNPDIIEYRIECYLKKNFYRITEKGPGFIIFVEDEFSDRKNSRHDVHKRIGEGKFEWHSLNLGTEVKLIYLTPVVYPVFLIMLFSAVGIYIRSLMPMLFSFAFVIPIIHKVYNMNNYLFKEVFEDVT